MSKRKNRNLKQMTSGYVSNKESVMVVGTAWDAEDSERVLFRGTMWELRKVYRKNGWANKEVVRMLPNWNGFNALVFMINVNMDDEANIESVVEEEPFRPEVSI